MAENVPELAARLGRELPWWRVSAAGAGDPDLTHRWGALGGDGTAAWRAALTLATSRQYGLAPPPAMPAAFVLQWALEVPATIGAYAAVLGPWVVHPARAGLSFETDPHGHYPVHAQVREVEVVDCPAPERLELARAAYLRDARELALSYQPGVRLGPHQRVEMVGDVWAMAAARATHAAAPARGSCCFIYLLPGAHECAGCPRLRRRGEGS